MMSIPIIGKNTMNGCTPNNQTTIPTQSIINMIGSKVLITLS